MKKLQAKNVLYLKGIKMRFSIQRKIFFFIFSYFINANNVKLITRGFAFFSVIFFFHLQYFVLIFIKAISSDTILANGVQNRRKNSVDVKRNFAETTAAISDLLDDGQITLPPLTDDANQSTTKKVSDTLGVYESCNCFRRFFILYFLHFQYSNHDKFLNYNVNIINL